jgi:signal transduction histidine kinase
LPAGTAGKLGNDFRLHGGDEVGADRMVRLSQVISDLLSNAARYTEKPSQIWITAEKSGDEVSIRVRDPGTGIAPEMLSQVFNLFVQGDVSLSRTQGGLGIGLTLVKRIVELHGGSVTATSPGLTQGMVSDGPCVDRTVQRSFGMFKLQPKLRDGVPKLCQSFIAWIVQPEGHLADDR